MDILAIALIRIVFSLVFDLLAAMFVYWFAPFTGIDAISSLDYWNSFFVVLTASAAVWPTVALSASSS